MSVVIFQVSICLWQCFKQAYVCDNVSSKHMSVINFQISICLW